ncbi:MAG: hypothetical protein PF638_04765 [Candidatus Delongbacteria bacterium]|jgi:hypothetical protein|nr:hypothetical protein [Candidatus Delongbacteria bacterium]
MYRFLNIDDTWVGPGTEPPVSSPDWFSIALILIGIIFVISMIAYNAGKRKKDKEKDPD